MKALLCKQFGPLDSLTVEETPAPTAGTGEVVIAVRACGVGFPDTLIVQGKYQLKPEPPFSPGGEIAGVVESVGAGVTAVKPGDRVIGFAPWGGLAEKVKTDASQLFAIPNGVDFVKASSVLCAYGTTLHALRDRANLKSGESLLVLGAAGGVGLSAIQVGKLLGARVIAVASTEEKRALCTEHGADHAIGYGDLKARIKELTKGDGVDVVYDPVGGEWAEPALRSMGWNGRYLVIGFAAGDIPRVPLNLPLLKGCAIVGVFWGSFLVREHEKARAQLLEVLAWTEQGKIAPHVSATYPLELAASAIRDVAERRAKGRVVVTM